MFPAPLRRAAAEQHAAVRSFFDAEAADYARSRERQYSFAVQRELVLELLPDRPGRVLDAGCGPAVMAEPLLERGAEVWGVDASEEMIRLGEERLAAHPARSRLHLRTGTLEALEFTHGTFDAAIAMGVLEYVPDRVHALAELRRVLRPGGVLVLTIPSALSAYHLARGAWARTLAAVRRAAGRPPERLAVRRCVPWLLDRELARAGLVKLEARFCNFIFFPLQELAPAVSLALNGKLAGLVDHPLGSCLGAQYVVQAMRR